MPDTWRTASTSAAPLVSTTTAVLLRPRADLATALGLASPKVRWDTEGRFEPVLRLVDARGQAPKLGGVGELEAHVAPSRAVDVEAGDIAEIPEGSTIQWGLRVNIPESALSFEHDAFAGPAVVNALLAIAGDPTLLTETPEDAHARLPDLGDRYALPVRFLREPSSAHHRDLHPDP